MEMRILYVKRNKCKSNAEGMSYFRSMCVKERIKNEWVLNEYGLNMRVQCKGIVEIVLSYREINED